MKGKYIESRQFEFFFFHHESWIIGEKGIAQPKPNGNAKVEPSKIKKDVVVDFKGKTRT